MKFKKLLSRIIIATMITFTGTLSYQAIEQTHISHAAHNYYGKKQCTWWAFKRRAQLGKPVSNRWGMLRIGIAMQLDISLENTLLCNQREAIMGT